MEKAAFLIDKYISGEAPPEEEQQLLNFYGSFSKSDKDYIDRDISSLDDKIYERIMRKIDHRVKAGSFTGKNVVGCWTGYRAKQCQLIVTNMLYTQCE